MADASKGVITEPRLVELKADWTFHETTTPNVAKTSDGFIMAFAGRRGRYDNRRLFIAKSDTLDGPWEVSAQSYSPSNPWEGRNIDLGPGNITEGNSILFFYSSAYPRLSQIATAFLRRPHIPSESNLMRYEKRRIGILRVGIREPRTINGSACPLPLKCIPGTSFESVFCPGYTTIDDHHLFFVVGSNYSLGYPFEQSIGVVESQSSPTAWDTEQEIRSIITSKDLPPPFSDHPAFDTPDVVPTGGSTLKLHFSVMSRGIDRWSIMACDLTADCS